MRKLAWFTAGFSAAAALFAYLFSGKALLIIAAICGILSTASLFVKQRNAAIVSMALFGLAAGMLYTWGYDALVLKNLRQYDGREVYITVEAADFAFETDYGAAVDGVVDIEGRKTKVRLFYEGPADAQPGDILKGTALIRYTPKDGLQVTTYHKGEAIFLLAQSQKQMTIYRQEGIRGKYFASYLRKDICQRIDHIFPETTAFFAKALLLGDDTAISFADNMAFQKSGIRHVVAVSGLHVSILMAVVYFLTARRKSLTVFISVPMLFVFAAVAGFTPSVIRACFMHALFVIAIAVEKEYDPITAICFSVLVMLVQNPMVITSVSFQLSIACMLGMFLFSAPIQRYLLDRKRLGRWKVGSVKARLARWFSGSVSISLSTMLATMPLCAAYFGTISVIGIVTNLLCLWVISFVFCGIIVSCILSLIWLPLGTVAASAVSLPVHFVLWIVRGVSQIPFGAAYTDSPYMVIWIITVYILLTLCLFVKQKRPVLLTCGILALYFIGQFASFAEPYTDSVRMTVIDVGQGQCVLLQSKSNAYLIDCGGDDPDLTASRVINQMHAQGVYRLDGLILTHYDTDHANAAANLISAVPVETLYLPNADLSSPIRKNLTLQDTPVCWVNENASFSCGTGTIKLFPAELAITGNESSMCILFQSEKCDILITGDRNAQGELALLQQGIGDIDVLVAGHHGADTSTSLALLQQTKPEIVVISAGESNLHGHPSMQTLMRLERFGCQIRRTDLEGTIIIRG